jgi:NAD(P)-dependent dehydrogenase (short-subunit alcohol dehydrogenase family)
MDFSGKVLLVTGATGMAAATARLAAASGAAVYVASLDEAECRALADAVSGAYSACDLTDSAAAAAAVERCIAVHGRIDCLWNAAGISGRRYGDGPVHECSDEGWDATLSHNLRSMFLVNRAVLRHMLARGAGGAIVNMGSISALSPSPAYFATHAYAAAKAGVVGLTLAMAAYYAPHGIRVNAVAPGLVRTPMSRRAQADPEIQAYIARKQPLIRGILEPEQVAEAALFLLSDAASGITGHVLDVDGGWTVAGV